MGTAEVYCFRVELDMLFDIVFVDRGLVGGSMGARGIAERECRGVRTRAIPGPQSDSRSVVAMPQILIARRQFSGMT